MQHSSTTNKKLLLAANQPATNCAMFDRVRPASETWEFHQVTIVSSGWSRTSSVIRESQPHRKFRLAQRVKMDKPSNPQRGDANLCLNPLREYTYDPGRLLFLAH
eukprot:4812531-Amphidinium_carterae.1